jgi:hypothetical protein
MVVRHRKGQSTVEMMLYISVIVVVMVLTAWIGLGPKFQEGWDSVAGSNGDAIYVIQWNKTTPSNEKR